MPRIAILIVAGVLLAFGVSMLMGRSGPTADPAASVAAAGEIEIMPTDPFTNTTLTARRAGRHTADAGEVSSWTWYRNGAKIPGASTETLNPALFAKGDEIAVEAVLEPGARPRRSKTVTIHGARPQITSALATHREQSAEIYVQASAMDADGDDLTFRYTWFRNGTEIAGASAPTLDVSGFRNGDRIHASVVADDGEASSAPFVSDAVVLGSDAPAITSTPPRSLEDGRYVYQVTTTQHDPGSLSFELVDAPAGMTIDDKGRIDWVVPQDQTDVVVHAVAVRVAHPNGGETVQHFTITTGPVTAAAVQ